MGGVEKNEKSSEFPLGNLPTESFFQHTLLEDVLGTEELDGNGKKIPLEMSSTKKGWHWPKSFFPYGFDTKIREVQTHAKSMYIQAVQVRKTWQDCKIFQDMAILQDLVCSLISHIDPSK